MRLLAASAEGHLQETITLAGGINSVITADRREPVCFELDMPLKNQNPIQYELSIQSNGVWFVLQQERLIQKRDKPRAKDPVFKHIDSHGQDIMFFDPVSKKLTHPTWGYSSNETSLSQVPKMFKEPEDFRRILASSTLYHALDVSARAPVRLPQPMTLARFPGQNGEYLVSCLYYLRESEPDRFDAIEDTLKVVFPDFERLLFPPVAAGTLALGWKERQYLQPLNAHQLSEGTLRFLWLVTLLQSPELPTVTLIDEPEVSLHPEMLHLLSGLFREAATRTQLIVATHSERLVRFLEPSELLICDSDEEGGMTLTRASALDLEAWLQDYSLDQLWEMGQLGGRI
ncbi:chromosome segregation protein SMC [Betaproteobacteria bacterium]|nr:chromosome segregation protein SMC [Betaproteobacteria bacterium]